jgi:hypothetical protein
MIQEGQRSLPEKQGVKATRQEQSQQQVTTASNLKNTTMVNNNMVSCTPMPLRNYTAISFQRKNKMHVNKKT